MAASVAGRTVDEVGAFLDPRQDGRLGGVVVGRTPDVPAELPGADSDFGDSNVAVSELPVFHCVSFRLCGARSAVAPGRGSAGVGILRSRGRAASLRPRTK